MSAIYRYGERSLEVFQTLHGDLQTLCGALIQLRDVSLLEGNRSLERQQDLFNQRLTEARPGESQHNQWPSLAVDLCFYPCSEADWKDKEKWHLFAGFVLGVAASLRLRGTMKYAVRWGGDWDRDGEVSDERFRDFPHFELVV